MLSIKNIVAIVACFVLFTSVNSSVIKQLHPVTFVESGTTEVNPVASTSKASQVVKTRTGIQANGCPSGYIQQGDYCFPGDVEY